MFFSFSWLSWIIEQTTVFSSSASRLLWLFYTPVVSFLGLAAHQRVQFSICPAGVLWAQSLRHIKQLAATPNRVKNRLVLCIPHNYIAIVSFHISHFIMSDWHSVQSYPADKVKVDWTWQAYFFFSCWKSPFLLNISNISYFNERLFFIVIITCWWKK